jgi:short-subunit dehydrogenase
MIINKRIAITGHNTGIGKAMYDLLSKDNTVIGFSRHNGYDLSNKEKYQEAISIIKDCDITINNAYSYDYRFLQTDILNDFLDQNTYDDSKLILTLGSMSKYIVRPVTAYNRYASSKVLIDDTVNRAKLSGHTCGLIVVSPNWVDTNMFDLFKQRNPQEAVSVNPLSPEELAEQMVMLIEMFYDKNINIYSYEAKRMKTR